MLLIFVLSQYYVRVLRISILFLKKAAMLKRSAELLEEELNEAKASAEEAKAKEAKWKAAK